MNKKPKLVVVKGKLVDVSEVTLPVLRDIKHRRGRVEMIYDTLLATSKFDMKTTIMNATYMNIGKLSKILKELKALGLVNINKKITLTEEGKYTLALGKAYIKGEILTVEELKKRYSLALAINNQEVFKVLLNAEKPLKSTEILKGLGMSGLKTQSINSLMRKLFSARLVVRFYVNGHSFGYLLSEEGYHNLKKAEGLDS